MKRAEVVKRDAWYFSASSRTTVGVWIGTAPYLRLDNDSSLESLGQAALAALQGSQPKVPHPIQSQWKEVSKPLLELAGVKTWDAFEKSATTVSIQDDGEWLAIEPWKKATRHKGFVPIPGLNVKVPSSSSPEAIGEALKKAFEMCNTAI